MNRFRKHHEREEAEKSAPRVPLREYKDDAEGSPPSMFLFRFEIAAYWLLPVVIFCVILIVGIVLVVKFNGPDGSLEGEVSRAAYLTPSGEILVPELLESYMTAVGGRDALQDVRSMRYKGHIKEASGEIPFQILVSLPDKGMIITNPGEERSQKLVLNGDTAWQVVGMGDGSRKIFPLDEASTGSLKWSLQVHHTFRRLILKGRGNGFTVREVDFSGRPAYELTKIMPDGSRFLALLDAETLYLVKSVETVSSSEGVEQLEVIYRDHRLVSGIVEAYETTTYKEGKLYNRVFLDSIEADPGLISALFEVPAELSK